MEIILKIYDNIILRNVIEFILLFLLFYIVYDVFLNKKRREYAEGKKSDEIRVFILKYDLDMRKTEYKKVLKAVTLMNSFILSFSTIVVINISGFMLGLLVGFLVIVVLIYSLYEIVGRSFKRKEVKKNV